MTPHDAPTAPMAPVDLESMVAEVERLRVKYGDVPVRYQVGVHVWEALAKVATKREPRAGEPFFIAEWRGVSVVLGLDLAPDEWAPVYRVRRG